MDEVKNYPPYLDYPKPYKAEVSTDCINRKAFIGEIEKHYCAPCKGQGGDLGGDWCRSCVINSVLEKIREFPAADKTDECCDVHHAHWIKQGLCQDPDTHCSYTEYSCSYCGIWVDDRHGLPEYCPECGEKMEGNNE